LCDFVVDRLYNSGYWIWKLFSTRTEIDARLHMFYSVMWHTDFAKAFFTLKVSHGCTVHA